MAPSVALSLVLVFTIASGRTLACEWVCEASGPEQASESCQHGSGAVAESQMVRVHLCDLGTLAITFATVKTGIPWRFATIASAMAIPLHLGRMHLALGHFRTSLLGTRLGSRTRPTSVLRI